MACIYLYNHIIVMFIDINQPFQNPTNVRVDWPDRSMVAIKPVYLRDRAQAMYKHTSTCIIRYFIMFYSEWILLPG